MNQRQQITIAALACLMCLGSVSIGAVRTAAQEAGAPLKIKRATTESYQDILRKVKQTDSGVSFLEFRLAYADSDDYKPGADPDTRNAMFGALNSKDYRRAAELAESILQDRYVDIYAHQAASVAYRELGDRAKATIHNGLARELVRSIVDSGDGQTPETAMMLISEDEETVVLQALQLKMVAQELMDVKGSTVDRVETVDTGEGHVTLYFNLDVPVIKVKQKLAAMPLP